MAQKSAWDKEYKEQKLITGSDEPQKGFLKYIKHLKKSGVNTNDLKILDLGSGTGRNANYLASIGNNVTGLEISKNAIKIATERAKKLNVSVKYINQSIGEKFPCDDNSLDLVIDVTSSNSLNESERLMYLKETQRTLKDDGNFFVRGLLKDGDKNAQNLLKMFPGKEKDTYRTKELGITERVFSEKDFRELYSKYFQIDKIIKTSGYAKVEETVYKRRYFVAYLNVKPNISSKKA